jgi:hypothetical protein
MPQLNESPDDRDDCQDCGEQADIFMIGRRWCKKCWEAFEVDYLHWISQLVESK